MSQYSLTKNTQRELKSLNKINFNSNMMFMGTLYVFGQRYNCFK